MKKFGLYIFCGIPFSGKTTLSGELVRKFGFVRVDLDEVKFDLFGKGVKDESLKQSAWDEIYREMYRRIGDSLKKGRVVISDTGNFTKRERDSVRQIAGKLKIESATVYLQIPKSIARQRLLDNRKTGDRFDVRRKDFESAVAEMEPPTEDENPIVFDGSLSTKEWISKYFRRRQESSKTA